MSKSEKDKELIRQAWAIHYTHWSDIDNIIEQAESEETKRTLKSIQVHKYHKEEASEGLLRINYINSNGLERPFL